MLGGLLSSKEKDRFRLRTSLRCEVALQDHLDGLPILPAQTHTLLNNLGFVASGWIRGLVQRGWKSSHLHYVVVANCGIIASMYLNRRVHVYSHTPTYKYIYMF